MQWIRSARSSHYAAPRTILGFFLGIAAIAVLGGAALLYALNGEYAGQIIAFVGAFVLLVAGIVVYAMFKDPMALMLGEVKGTEFLEHQRLTRGDSLVGEYIDASIPGSSEPPELSPGEANEQEADEL